jgi:hypothetical protein
MRACSFSGTNRVLTSASNAGETLRAESGNGSVKERMPTRWVEIRLCGFEPPKVREQCSLIRAVCLRRKDLGRRKPENDTIRTVLSKT